MSNDHDPTELLGDPLPNAAPAEPGRIVTVNACGDTAQEIEQDALAQARAFFGDGSEPRIARNWGARAISRENHGKNFGATVTLTADN